ncbi:MAG: hypothetical protein JXQ26_08785 [Tissierellales bacterium]|jgi:TusA-related sulfurtransferase|nr:hypothetical protein [Tissierellales bacterium]MBN2828074.1 hypothetical protein [Tissierellales bacterium]
MIKPMTITELKKELKKLEQSELIELISGLYKTNDKVKEIVRDINIEWIRLNHPIMRLGVNKR